MNLLYIQGFIDLFHQQKHNQPIVGK